MRVACGIMLACCLLTGCQNVVSLNGIIPDSAAVLEPRLLGTWLDSSDGTHYVVQRLEDHDYLITYTDDGVQRAVRGRLGRAGSRWVLDVTPEKIKPDSNTPVAAEPDALWIPTHALAVVAIGEQELKVVSLNGDSVKAYLESGRLPLAYVALARGDIVLTSPTAALMGALPAMLGKPGVLTDTTIMQRLSGH